MNGNTCPECGSVLLDEIDRADADNKRLTEYCPTSRCGYSALSVLSEPGDSDYFLPADE